MSALVAYVLRLISLVGEVLGIVQSVQAGQAVQATAVGVAALEAEVKDIQLKVNDSVIGLSAIRDQTDLIYTALTAATGTIEGQLTTMQAGLDSGTTVTVLSSGDPNLVAIAVWEYVDTFIGRRAIDIINLPAQYAIHASAIDNYLSGSSFAWPWVVSGDWSADSAPNPNTSNTFDLDFTTILASDLTAWDWADRTMNPDAGFFQNSDGLPSIYDFTSGNWVWTLYLPQLTWDQLKASLGLTATSDTAPVWPGLANVTLGTPVALDLTLTVDGPMDGVIVALTAYPTLKGQYLYGDMVSALKIGSLTFVSDNGDAEFIQVLGFLNEVYCPKSMSRASSCKLRTVSGVTGTITPWLRS